MNSRVKGLKVINPAGRGDPSFIIAEYSKVLDLPNSAITARIVGLRFESYSLSFTVRI